MEIIKTLLVFAILFGANLLQAITGFAGTMLSMPPVIKLIGVGESKALLNAICQISSLMIVVTGYKYVNWKIYFRIFILMALGITAGIQIFRIFPVDSLLTFYGLLIIAVGLKKLFVKKDITLPDWSLLFVVLAAGIIEGMFVSGGSLLVIYASAVLKDKEEFRATLAMTWLTLGFYMTTVQYMEGNFNSHVMFLLIVGIIPVFAGTLVGTKLMRYIKQETFMKITYVLLLMAGVMAII